MNKSVTLLLVLVFLITPSIATFLPVKAESKTITVPDDYPTIQQAVDYAKSGDVVYVKQGIYYEAVVLDKPLTLKGIGYPIINADRKGSAITINASNCIVDGFKVTNSLRHWGEGGIKVQYYSGGNNIIKNNISFNNTQGIYVQKTAHNSIINNTVFDNKRGIEFWVENDDYIADNTVYSNGDIGILCMGGNMSVRNNIVYLHNEAGIMLDGCDDGYIKGNRVFSNGYGIHWGYGGDGNFIIENNITDNGWGIRWWSALGGNYIYHNTIVNNVNQAKFFDESPNQVAQNCWNDRYPSGGNFWSDYNGSDIMSGQEQNVTGSDDIGDVPYTICSNNIDNFPLMAPYTPPEQELLSIDIVSNSTITQLSFDLSNKQVNFKATGPSGTYGFTEIVLTKTLVSNPEDISIFLDEKPINFTIKSVGDQWFLIVDYSHSTHNIMLRLETGNMAEIPAENTTLTIVVVSIVSAIAIGLLLVYFKKRKH